MSIGNKNYFNLYLLILFSFIVRIAAIHHYGDVEIEYEWKELLNNLYNSGVLSLYQFDGKFIPSVFMPPLYVYFLYALKLFTPENVDLIKVILFSQAILSTVSIFIFYKLNNLLFSKNWSILNAFLLSAFPLKIYTVTQISSITLQIFLLILYLYLFFLFSKSGKFVWYKIIFFSIVSGLLMLTRGEFYIIFLISLIYLFFLKKINLKESVVILLISLLVISPYLTRNYLAFNKIVLTNSLGFNLWKGNNPFSTVEGSLSDEAHKHDMIYQKIDKLPKNNLFEFYHDDLFLQEGLIHIKNKPAVFIERFIKRSLSFFYFNVASDYPNYYHPLFIVPIFLLSIFSSFGILISFKDLNFKTGYLLLNLFSTIIIFSLFFILPRYKMMILPIQLIFMNYFFIACSKKLGFLKNRS